MRNGIGVSIFIIAVSVLDALGYILYKTYGGKEFMGVAETVAICVAVIGAASGIWTQVIQFRKDSGAIKDVKNDVKDVRGDAKDIRSDIKDVKIDTQKLYGIENSLEKVKDNVIEKIVPQINGIEMLVDECKFRQKIKEQGNTFANEEIFKASIEELFDKNASLMIKVKELNADKKEIINENVNLKAKISNLEIEKEKLLKELEKYRNVPDINDDFAL